MIVFPSFPCCCALSWIDAQSNVRDRKVYEQLVHAYGVHELSLGRMALLFMCSTDLLPH